MCFASLGYIITITKDPTAWLNGAGPLTPVSCPPLGGWCPRSHVVCPGRCSEWAKGSSLFCKFKQQVHITKIVAFCLNLLCRPSSGTCQAGYRSWQYNTFQGSYCSDSWPSKARLMSDRSKRLKISPRRMLVEVISRMIGEEVPYLPGELGKVVG